MRFWNNLITNHLSLRRMFPAEALQGIEQAVQQSEKRHTGEVCVAIEPSMSLLAVARGVSPRERAVEVFSEQRVWDTEYNCGVLIYILLAERAIEVVVDRGIAARVAQAEWDSICAVMSDSFSHGRYQAGVEAGVEKATALLSGHFPRSAPDQNEIADKPVVL